MVTWVLKNEEKIFWESLAKVLKNALEYLTADNAFGKEKGCKCRVAYNHDLLGYPFYLDYDYVDGILLLHQNEKTNNGSVPLFNRCLSKQLDDGSFPVEQKRSGCMHHFLRLPVALHKQDALTTIRVISMLYETGCATVEV